MENEKNIFDENSQFEDIVGYKEDRFPDYQYRALLQTILKKGVKVDTQLEESARTVFGYQLRYDLRNGFPLITERDLTLGAKASFAEMTAFINGVRTLEDLKAWGCGWWDKFVTDRKTEKRGLPPGDLGDGSYGVAYHDFPTPTGIGFNQIKAIVDQINENPHLRTHMATTIVPQTNFRAEGYEQKTVWVPCHGNFVHFRILGDEIHLHHAQRSADAPVGLVFNIAQYAALLLVIAKVTGYRPGDYVHTISDAHIYKRQEEEVAELLNRDPRPFPRALVWTALDNAFDWRKDHIKLEDYNPHPGMRIDTPSA